MCTFPREFRNTGSYPKYRTILTRLCANLRKQYHNCLRRDSQAPSLKGMDALCSFSCKLSFTYLLKIIKLIFQNML